MKNKSLDMPFWDHLEELRWRLIKSIVAILIGSLISYNYSNFIISFLIEPTKTLSIGLNLQIINVTSMFMVKMTIALFGGVFFSLPIIFYQIWMFISPAFEKKYNLLISFMIILTTIFFIIGISFAYFIIIPFSLSFFTSLTHETLSINYNYTLDSYLIYIIWILFGTGLLFQLPVVSILFTSIGIFTPHFLMQYRKVAIIMILIVSAIMTPPDPVSQLFISFPLIILYELSILISKGIYKNK